MSLPEQLALEAQALVDQLTAQNLMLATAESCTAGMIAATLADISGASAVLERGFVTYSNEAKMDMLGVSGATLARHGAVMHQHRHLVSGADQEFVGPRQH